MKPHLFGLLQRCADVLTLVVSFGLGYWLYRGPVFHRFIPYSLGQYLELGTLAGILFIIVFHSHHLYENKTSLLKVVETRRLLLGWALGALILLTSTFYIRWLDLSRLMISFSLVISFLLLIIQRSISYQLYFLSRLRSGGGRQVVIYGAGVVGRHLFKRIYHSPGLGLHVAGFLDDDPKLQGQAVKIGEVRHTHGGNFVLGGFAELAKIAAAKSVQEVFVALPNATYSRNMDIVQACRKLGLSVSVVPPTYGQQMHALEVDDIGGIPVLREKEHRPYFLYPILKRLFDLLMSGLILLALSPIFLVLCLLVKLDSPGPILFRQKRVGLRGKEFSFYKFRTMKAGSDPYALTPRTPQDPRITSFGRWLRRTSLDELPQLWNVIRGEMSIVGPRPEMPFIVAEYNEEQRERLKVKPGITGVWQISAVRGEPIHANMEYDLFYIEHQSLLLDLIIMIKTLATAARGIGAI